MKPRFGPGGQRISGSGSSTRCVPPARPGAGPGARATRNRSSPPGGGSKPVLGCRHRPVEAGRGGGREGAMEARRDEDFEPRFYREGTTGGGRILVIDDDEQVRYLLRYLLTHEGFEVDD